MRSKHSVFGEAIGLTLLGVNHTFTVPVRGEFKAGTRVGFCYYFPDQLNSALVPVEACFLYGRKWHAEAALGYTFIFSIYDLGGSGRSWIYDSSPALTVFAGARYQPENGGLFFRGGISTPMEIAPGDDTDMGYQPAYLTIPVIAFGYTFK